MPEWDKSRSTTDDRSWGLLEARTTDTGGRWKIATVGFCAFFSSLYMILKLPVFTPFFRTGTKEVVLLSIVAGCVFYAFLLDVTSTRLRYVTSPAFVAGFLTIAFVCGHVLAGTSRETVSLAALQISLFPMLFLFVGGIQTDLRGALTSLSIALVATGVVALPFVFWDAATGDAFILNNIDRSRDYVELTWISYEGTRRQAGIFEGGLQLSSHLGLAVMGATYLILRKKYRLICLIVLPFLALGIALSLSRLGLLAMLIGSFVTFGAFRNRRLLQAVSVTGTVVLGLVVLSTVFPDAIQRFGQRSLSLFTGDVAQDARYKAWDYAFESMLSSPFGIGIGTAGGKVQRESQVLIPESTFLKIGVELGFAGMIAFLSLYVIAIRQTLGVVVKIPGDETNAEIRLDIAFLAGLICATLVNHAFVQAIEYFSYGLVSMLILGIALNLRIQRQTEAGADIWSYLPRS